MPDPDPLLTHFFDHHPDEVKSLLQGDTQLGAAGVRVLLQKLDRFLHGLGIGRPGRLARSARRRSPTR